MTELQQKLILGLLVFLTGAQGVDFLFPAAVPRPLEYPEAAMRQTIREETAVILADLTEIRADLAAMRYDVRDRFTAHAARNMLDFLRERNPELNVPSFNEITADPK